MDDKERLNAERDARRTKYRAAIDPKWLAKIDTRRFGEDDAGIRYQPFNGVHVEGPRAEIEVDQIYNGILGSTIRELLRVEENELIYAGLADARTRGMMFPQGLNPWYETALVILRRWDHLDTAHAEVLARIAAARAPRIVPPTPEERIAALEARLAALESA
ncbi:MAG TPA: hypothetical protein VGV64_03330 [Thermoplasmata archaeon]|nr:hypothetical protein [Thermoplasmata archaeon]